MKQHTPASWSRTLFSILCLLLTLVMCAGCDHQQDDPHHITVGIIDGPETQLWEIAQRNALAQYNLTIKLVRFNDYVMPNEALANGDIDANAFQHEPFLKAQIASRNYPLTVVAKTFIFPMGLYSQRIHTLDDLKSGHTIAIPNDPSNEARALMLLAQAGLIRMHQPATTPEDITYNPKQLHFHTMDAAQLPRVLPDVTAAAITDDFAQPAGLLLNQALTAENAHSPYVNIIAARTSSMQQPAFKRKIMAMVASFQRKNVIEAAKKMSHGTAVVGWHKPSSQT